MEYVQLAEPVLAPMSLQNLEPDRGAYTATKKTGHGISNQGGNVYTEEELLALGFKQIDWNGIDPIPLVDQDNCMFAVLAGQPRDPGYLRDADEAYEMIIEEGKTAKFDSKFKFHKRGDFPAVNLGPICGAGSEHPMQQSLGSCADTMERLCSAKPIQQLINYQSSSVQLWAPRIFEYIQTHMKTLFSMPTIQGSIQKIFPCSVFPCVAFNFGGQVQTWPHRDMMNLLGSWCTITALGKFDAKLSAKLVLWEAKLIITFPLASAIDIPSALLTHFNTSIQPGNFRVSITQYCPGGLCQWVDNGGHTDKVLEKKDPKEFT
ncbi:hypothetical protein H0H92_002706 [Tricholoma furcatifolium]|nr:hypothetical protein H0H92_002706 [Tricholoma furcatifolium]